MEKRWIFGRQGSHDLGGAFIRPLVRSDDAMEHKWQQHLVHTTGVYVGIGTNTPSSLLQTYTPSISTNTDVLTLQAGFHTVVNAEQIIKFHDLRGFHLGYVGGGFMAGSGGYLAFGTSPYGPGVAAVERMRIDNLELVP